MTAVVPPIPPAGQRGLSLVELMIAMTIGLMLTAGVIQIMLGSKQSYRVTAALSELQESARVAMVLLGRDVRMAGFMGCDSRITNPNNLLNGPPASFNPGVGIEGWEAGGTAPGSFAILTAATPVDASTGTNWTTAGGGVLDASTDSLANSDIIRVWYGENDPPLINSITPGVGQTVVNTTPASFTAGDILLLTDCSNIDWAQASNVQSIGGGASTNAVLSAGSVPGNLPAQPLQTGTGGHVYRLEGVTWYVGKRGNDPQNPPALFRRPLGGNAAGGAAQEIVEGVESMQILYGEDTGTDRVADRYVTAGNVANWQNVVSVRISLLMQSVADSLATAAQSLAFNGSALAAPDRRLRYAFTSTIALRNRAP